MGKIGHDKDLGKLIPSEDYTQYRLLSIEEAEFILCDVYSYIHDDFLKLSEKSARIEDVINFFENVCSNLQIREHVSPGSLVYKTETGAVVSNDHLSIRASR